MAVQEFTLAKVHQVNCAALPGLQPIRNSMSELTIEEIEFVSGAFSMSNGGNWGNTWTQTGIWAGAGAIAGSRGGLWGIGLGAAGGAIGGFFGSFTYTW